MADIESAKAYLLKASSNTGTNLYDHLASVLKTILDEKKDDAFSGTNLEDLSSEIKTDRHMETTTIQSDPDPLAQVALATTQEQLFKPSSVDNFDDEDAEVEPVIPNMMEQSQYFEDAGLGLGREETFRVLLALKQLQTQESFSKIRFWGKILGIKANYLIAECQYTGGDAFSPDGATGADVDDDEDEEGKSADDDVPESQYQAPMVVPSESYASGVNKYVYYVCNEAGSPWIRLPHATPRHIVVARQIRKLMTGDLSTAIHSYPPFNGTEAEYLRAQIAQISADCIISPQGFYTFDEDDEEEEEERDAYIKDPEYEGLTRDKLIDAEGEGPDGWCHHVQHILPQGRCKWVNTAIKPKKPLNEDGEEEEEEDEDEDEEVQPETGPSLLSSIMQDPPVDAMPASPAWSAKLTSQKAQQFAGVILSSNRWPGAHALAYNKGLQFQNVYLGWGHKYSSQPFSPPLPPTAEAEFKTGQEIMEKTDPTPQEVDEFNARNAEEEDDDDDDDDDGDDE